MTTASNNLSLSKKEEDKQDDLLAALSVLAKPSSVNKSQKEHKLIKKKHRSRFFYQPSDSPATDSDSRKHAVHQSPALLAHNSEVDKRLNCLEKELPLELSGFIKQIREFFLVELGPRTLAAQAGTAQALDIVQRLLDSEIDNKPFVQFKNMLEEAGRIRMAKYIAQYMKLPQSSVEHILKITAPKTEIYFPTPMNIDMNAKLQEKKEK